MSILSFCLTESSNFKIQAVSAGVLLPEFEASVKMWCGAGPLAVVAAVLWTQCVLLDGVDAKKERKKLKEAPPQQTETYNATFSNSEEVGGSAKVRLFLFFIFYFIKFMSYLLMITRQEKVSAGYSLKSSRWQICAMCEANQLWRR